MHGYSVDELIGRHLGIFHTKEQLETEVNPFIKQVLEAGSGEREIGHVRRRRRQPSPRGCPALY